MVCPCYDLDKYWILSPAGQLWGCCRGLMGPNNQMKKSLMLLFDTLNITAVRIHVLCSPLYAKIRLKTLCRYLPCSCVYKQKLPMTWWCQGPPKLLQFILRTSVGVTNVMTIHPIVVETFYSKPQMWTLWRRWRKSEGIKSFVYIIWESWISVQRFTPVHPVDVEIFHRVSENTDLLVMLEEKARDH